MDDQNSSLGSCQAESDHDREIPEIDLLSPLKIRGMTLRNRIVMSLMCQYVAKDGFEEDWYFGQFRQPRCRRGRLTIVQSTAVYPVGRVTRGS
jgi:2,4-dienoyl-CoA reductase-like NADH-dependent reductase (Old Yellow Enzyme family)